MTDSKHEDNEELGHSEQTLINHQFYSYVFIIIFVFYKLK